MTQDLINIIHEVIHGLGYLMALLVVYVILFKTYYGSEETRPWWLWPTALLFLAGDVAVNLVVMTPLMFDAPREWTVTSRMKRYKEIKRRVGLNRYRYWVAENLCLILNVFDKSKDGHC